MAAKLEKTRYPGIYKRGAKYAFIYTDQDGRHRQESAANLEAARYGKAKRESETAEGQSTPADARVLFADYAREWVKRYQGRGNRGFREITRKDYDGCLERYAIPYFARQRKTVAQITPRDVANFVGWLCEPEAQGERAAEERRRELVAAGRHADAERVVAVPVYLADATVRRILAPVRACLATAMAEDLIRRNPTAGTALPARDALRAAADGEDDEPDRRAFTREELDAVLTICPVAYRPLLRLLASTGVRISEALALRWKDLELNGSQPHLRVRRAFVKGHYGPPKSKHGKRDVPITHRLVTELRQLRKLSEWPEDDHLVFADRNGRPLHDRNLRRKLHPVFEEAGVAWAGWHTFRHTCASLLFASGRNAVQVQRWLGHHSPGFTLATYVHLMEKDLGQPLDLAVELGQGVRQVSGRQPEITGDASGRSTQDLHDLQG